ncbi:MAG: SLC13 family permease [Desulfobacterium sp.]|jgi:sodium-dependent dicarboxylate transporter 2/3/5|nr:SLC13 family permease [Desulfobacterium sp.]
MSVDMETNEKTSINWFKTAWLLVGVGLFALVYYSPAWPDAIDPMGKHFALSTAGKGAIAVFLMAGTWWVFEVIPIGVTSLAIGVMQTLFLIRPAKEAFKDFMDPSVMFIFGSIVIGLVFTKTGLTKRLAYKMLSIVGERTSMIYLGCFGVTAALTLIMAHTAVAATIYPLLVAIYALYGEGDKQTKFGKGLFIGMAYVAGAGSVVTLLGAARGAVALGFFKDIMGVDIGFFELSYYMAPVGFLMVALLWVYFMIVLKPEKKTIPGLKQRAKNLYIELGSITRKEVLAAIIVGLCILALATFAILKAFVAGFEPPDKTAVILISTILFFIVGILGIDDLEEIPWNIILLFAGAMSIGFCLWNTGAAEWMAINWLTFFKESHWFVFVMSIAFFVMVMTNFIMNVAAIAISLPVALVIAPYLNVSGEAILFTSLVVAGMPFLLLVGAAPNAIAYDSKQFTPGEFFLYGIPASIILLAVTAFAILVLWPLMGMPITLG